MNAKGQKVDGKKCATVKPMARLCIVWPEGNENVSRGGTCAVTPGIQSHGRDRRIPNLRGQ